MRVFSTIFLIGISFSLYGQSECSWQDSLEKLPLNDGLSREVICRGLAPIKNEAELKSSLEFFFKEAQKGKDSNRHQMTRNLNQCKPTQSSKALIIAFEGTGAYEPLAGATLASFNRCFGGKLEKSLGNKVYQNLQEIFKTQEGRDIKWSGLQAGIQEEISSMEKGNSIDWYSFPSEEVEQLAGLEEIKNFSLSQLHNSIKNSVASNPEGIKNARDCIVHYMTEAKRLSINPKIIIVSHSSGGRSLVKFAEHVKTDLGIPIDLAFSIDPVKEAHHAVEEVLPQKVGEPARFLAWKLRKGKGSDYPYSAVWHRSQPSVLYKPNNITEHINFYQLDDRLGLKMGGDALRFGIQGSPMEDAQNNHIKGTGISGHGEITYHPKVLETFNSKLSDLLK